MEEQRKPTMTAAICTASTSRRHYRLFALVLSCLCIATAFGFGPTTHDAATNRYWTRQPPRPCRQPVEVRSGRGSASSDLSDNTAPASGGFRYHHLKDIERIFCLSDLHTDHVVNMQWLRDYTTDNNSHGLTDRDLVIVAGDISHEFSTFTESLDILSKCCHVVFVPGNHEAWLNGTERNGIFDTSLDKLDQFYYICNTFYDNVYTDPVYIDGTFPSWILPLESWYDGTLTFDEDLCAGFEHWPWVDFARCRWPFPLAESPNDRIPVGLVEFFLKRNRRQILEPWRELLLLEEPSEATTTNAAIVTVSHFAPNQQCLPDWKDLNAKEFLVDEWLDHGAGSMSAKFSKVAGTALLDEQLRNLQLDEQQDRRHIHIFGHSHRPKDFEYRNIRYVHNPLGKPRERQMFMVSPDVNFQCLWTSKNGEVPGETVIRLWEEQGGGKEMLIKRMEEARPGRYKIKYS